ncbi:MAG: trypsin-like peptidase domain-containing protein [Aestuariivita sp.]|nr:trypsin-like peptidase domain-containing protein [Aestuariivita sp.]
MSCVFVVLLFCGATLVTEERVPQSHSEISLSFASVVRQAAPAVVNIHAKVIRPGRTSFFNDPFFSDFFRDFGTVRPRVQNSLGSGVILSAQGIVVSNYHVVGQATDIRVVLSDRREFSARVLLGDKESDLAILQLEGGVDLPFLEIRDSDRVEVGELVLAIGNPFGVGQTVSSGIVSGLARTISASKSARGYFIQTDAPINPGNSGGALIDISGKLIGINTLILSRSGGSNGIGLAIPANLVGQFVDQAMQGAIRFQRPWAGIEGQSIDSDLANSLGMKVPRGVLISEVHQHSSFLAADIRVGDIITHVDELEVNSISEMHFRMSVAGMGHRAKVTRLRDGITKDLEVAMIVPPDEPPSLVRTLGNQTALPGLKLAIVNPLRIEEFDLPLSASGILVIETGQFGGRVGLRSGDVILGLNGQKTETVEDFVREFVLFGRLVQIDLLRDKQRLAIRLRI